MLPLTSPRRAGGGGAGAGGGAGPAAPADDVDGDGHPPALLVDGDDLGPHGLGGVQRWRKSADEKGGCDCYQPHANLYSCCRPIRCRFQRASQGRRGTPEAVALVSGLLSGSVSLSSADSAFRIRVCASTHEKR